MTRLSKGLWLVATTWASVVALLALTLVGLQISGIRFNAVATESMTPTLPVDSLALTRQADTQRLQVGDVITFLNNRDQLVMHRVVEIVDHTGVRRFRTQGDANRTPDVQLVHERNVVGELLGSVPQLGALARTTQSVEGVFYFGLMLAPVVALAWRGKSRPAPPSTVAAGGLVPAWLA